MSESAASPDTPSRPEVVRDVAIFQVKLWLEGFKDVALMPLSFGAAVIDVIFGGSTLYAVMKLGDRFERWIHLYGALEAESEDGGPEGSPRSLDQLLNEAADGLEDQATGQGGAKDARTASEEGAPASHDYNSRSKG